jgi:hypothetical protein
MPGPFAIEMGRIHGLRPLGAALPRPWKRTNVPGRGPLADLANTNHRLVAATSRRSDPARPARMGNPIFLSLVASRPLIWRRPPKVR